VADGRPTTAEPAQPAAGDVVVRPGAMPVLDADDVAALARSGVLLDARAAPRYRGETEPVDPKAGHIPGARNLPATEITGPDGRVRAPAELTEQFAARGAAGATPVAAYCGSGVNAAALVLAAEHAGLRSPDDPVALFPGSWSQWSSDPSRPVATGVDP
jgi:thiosulfate/3-mercaptopyruvate sulfurtransferase